MPEHAQTFRFFRTYFAVFSPFYLILEMLNCLVYSYKLMVSGNEFDHFAHRIVKQDEIFKQVEQATFVAHAAQDGVEADHAFFIFPDAFQSWKCSNLEVSEPILLSIPLLRMMMALQ